MEFLEIIFALSFIYFLASVIASGINEAISMLFNKRGLELKRAILLLLNGDNCDWGDKFYAHPRIMEFKELPSRFSIRAVPQRLKNWLLRRKQPVLFNPSYVASDHFADVLFEFISLGPNGSLRQDTSTVLGEDENAFIGKMRRFLTSMDAFNYTQFESLYLNDNQPEYKVVRVLQSGLISPNATNFQTYRQTALELLDVYVDSHRKLLGEPGTIEAIRHSLIEIQDNPNFGNFQHFLATSPTADAFKTQLKLWFSDYMDRVSGWYKRRMHITILWIAAIITLIGNLDSIDIVQKLVVSQQFRETVVAAADRYIADHPQGFSHAGDFETEMDSIIHHISLTKEVFLPIGLEMDQGWPDIQQVFGWLISILAISLGAPFWFDMLNKIARLRATGKKPEPENT